MLEEAMNGPVNKQTNNQLTFTAEIKKVSSKKLASLDIEFQATLASNELDLYALGQLPADSLIKVTCEVING